MFLCFDEIDMDNIGPVGVKPIMGERKPQYSFKCTEYEKIVNDNGDDVNMDNEGIVDNEFIESFGVKGRTSGSCCSGDVPKDSFSDALSEKMRFARFNEDKIIKTLVDYISTTYGQHYVDGDKQTQTIETIRNDRIPGFCIGNITKYLDRYDKKGTPKSDLLKAAHYLILLLDHENIYN
jgi:hypothetical protein